MAPNRTTLKKLETLLNALRYNVIYAKGHFNSGYCIVKEQKNVVVNKFYETKERIIALIAVIKQIEIPEDIALDAKNQKLLATITTQEVIL